MTAADDRAAQRRSGRPVLVSDEIILSGQGDELAVRRPTTPVRTRYDLADSPLWACAERHSLWGRLVDDPAEIAEIRRRVEGGRRRRDGSAR